MLVNKIFNDKVIALKGEKVSKIDRLYLEMIKHDAGSPELIQHFIKVHSYSKLISLGEGVNDNLKDLIESAALVHDIGIKKALEIYKSSSGKYQEELGPLEARVILKHLCYEEIDISRICYLVGHHHTYDNIDGIDYQILVEADFLVNIFEQKMNEEQIEHIKNNIFKTRTGKRLLSLIYS